MNEKRTTAFGGRIGILEPAAEWTEEHLEWSDPSLEQRRRAFRPSTGWAWVQGDGRVEGHLLGGCIEVLEWMKGTRWWPPLDDWRGAVFYWETSEEAPKPETVLRWLRNYALQGIIGVLSGMLVGRPRFYSDDEHVALVAMLRRGGTTRPADRGGNGLRTHGSDARPPQRRPRRDRLHPA